LEPGDDVVAEFVGEGAEFVGIGLADGAGGVVFCGVAFGAAGVEVVCVVYAGAAKDDGECGEGAVVGEVFFRAVAAGVEEDGAEFEGGIVGDAELPVWGEVADGVFQIPVDDGEEIGDL
jgi:hypothetical protein